MIVDRFAGQHTATRVEAVRAFEGAVLAIAAHRPEAGAHLETALAQDPDLVAAHALKGLGAVMLARSETMVAARSCLADARGALDRRGGSVTEMALVDALEAAAAGGLRRAADGLDAHLAARPDDFLAAKLCHGLHFMCGDGPGMLETTRRTLEAWSPGMPGYGFLLGCHAFALEESGAYRDAERVGRAAVAREPRDAWGIHAVAHVLEMEGRTGEGVAWLDASRQTWTGCNNFSFHLAWHLALFWMAQGAPEVALDLYDREVRPRPTDDFRDVANAVSLLVRLEQEGVPVGGRWAELAELALRRRHDLTLVFATLHHLLALVGSARLEAADEILLGLQRRAKGEDDQARVAREVGLPLARALLARPRPRRAAPDLARLAGRLRGLGGSNAQRDLFVREIALLAARSGDRPGLEGVLAVRRRLKREDGFVGLVRARLVRSRPRSPAAWAASGGQLAGAAP